MSNLIKLNDKAKFFINIIFHTACHCFIKIKVLLALPCDCYSSEFTCYDLQCVLIKSIIKITLKESQYKKLQIKINTCDCDVM